jgi:hypothetical protein
VPLSSDQTAAFERPNAAFERPNRRFRATKPPLSSDRLFLQHNDFKAQKPYF